MWVITAVVLALLCGWLPLQAACTSVELATKLRNAPMGLDFATPIKANNEQAVLQMANKKQVGNVAFQVNRGAITGDEFSGLLNAEEFTGFPDHVLNQLGVLLMLGGGSVHLERPNVQDMLLRVIPAGKTHAAVKAYFVKDGSWAEVQCGKALTSAEVKNALHASGRGRQQTQH